MFAMDNSLSDCRPVEIHGHAAICTNALAAQKLLENRRFRKTLTQISYLRRIKTIQRQAAGVKIIHFGLAWSGENERISSQLAPTARTILAWGKAPNPLDRTTYRR
jgi:hypothetical protein